MSSPKTTIFALTFLALTGFGFVSQFLPMEIGLRVSEMRARGALPPVPRHFDDVPATIQTLNVWFDDNFRLRDGLTFLHAWVAAVVLHSSISESVVLGKDGWLFFKGQNNISDYRNLDPLSPERTTKFATTLEERTNWAASLHVKYIFAVAPNAHSIYPEFLPSWITKVGAQSRIDQLVAASKFGERYQLLDLRGTLLDHKSLGRLYNKTDTHWNSLGGFQGFLAIIKALNDDGTGIEIPAGLAAPLKAREQNLTGGDLARMVGLPFVFREDHVEAVGNAPWNYRTTRAVKPIYQAALEEALAQGGFSALQSEDFDTENKNAPNGQKVLVFRDSFGTAMQPFISETFRNVRFLWKGFSPAAVEAYHPDLIIEETVERSLQGYNVEDHADGYYRPVLKRL
jgi:alginate O-acetyltransferase complex protein AlgJ